MAILTEQQRTNYLFDCATALAGDMFISKGKKKSAVSLEKHLEMSYAAVEKDWEANRDLTSRFRLTFKLMHMLFPGYRASHFRAFNHLKHSPQSWNWLLRDDSYEITLAALRTLDPKEVDVFLPRPSGRCAVSQGRERWHWNPDVDGQFSPQCRKLTDDLFTAVQNQIINNL